MTIIFVGLIEWRNHDLDQLNKMDEALVTILPGVSISQGIHIIEMKLSNAFTNGADDFVLKLVRMCEKNSHL